MIALSKVAEKTVRKQRGRPFQKGCSGNPLGRPIGARNAATVLAEQLLDGEAAAITRKVIELAKRGDRVALRLCMERLVPPRRHRPVQLVFPTLNSAADASRAMAAIASAVGRGELTATEAAEMSGVVTAYMKAIEAGEIELRLRTLEEKQNAQ